MCSNRETNYLQSTSVSDLSRKYFRVTNIVLGITVLVCIVSTTVTAKIHNGFCSYTVHVYILINIWFCDWTDFNTPIDKTVLTYLSSFCSISHFPLQFSGKQPSDSDVLTLLISSSQYLSIQHICSKWIQIYNVVYLLYVFPIISPLSLEYTVDSSEFTNSLSIDSFSSTNPVTSVKAGFDVSCIKPRLWQILKAVCFLVQFSTHQCSKICINVHIPENILSNSCGWKWWSSFQHLSYFGHSKDE